MWALPVAGQYPGELIGRVVDSATGKPIVDAQPSLPKPQYDDEPKKSQKPVGKPQKPISRYEYMRLLGF